MTEHGNEDDVFRNKRKIDPETGEPREAAADAAASPGIDGAADCDEQAAGEQIAGDEQAADELSEADRALLDDARASMADELGEAKAALAAKDDELQRLRAEYVNFRNRSERDRVADRVSVKSSVVKQLLPALDDMELARKHGDLDEGPLAIVAQKLQAGFAALDVEAVGEVGEAFDTAKHEAIAQLPNPEVTEMVVADVVQLGYRVGDHLLRAAKVAVFVPAE